MPMGLYHARGSTRGSDTAQVDGRRVLLSTHALVGLLRRLCVPVQAGDGSAALRSAGQVGKARCGEACRDSSSSMISKRVMCTCSSRQGQENGA
jgi:hypothetical protein